MTAKPWSIDQFKELFRLVIPVGPPKPKKQKFEYLRMIDERTGEYYTLERRIR